MGAIRYGFERTLQGRSFDDVTAAVTAALKAEGFGVLTEIDVRDILKQKLNVDLRRYVILGACNPQLANQAIAAEPQIGLLLPCNVVVQDAPGTGVSVSIGDPAAMFSLVDNPAVAVVATEVEARLRRVMAALG